MTTENERLINALDNADTMIAELNFKLYTQERLAVLKRERIEAMLEQTQETIKKTPAVNKSTLDALHAKAATLKKVMDVLNPLEPTT